MRILVIEDEAKTALFLKKGLSEQGYSVEICGDGTHGLELAVNESFDAVILDIMIPGKDGKTVLSAIRQKALTIPVLVLTARDSVEDRVEGLELGADDYLVKPFSFSELLARLRTIMRRGSQPEYSLLQIEDLKIDLVHHRVTRDSRKIELTPKEYTILVMLARKPGQVFTRTVIADQVWGMDFDRGSNFVDVHIRRLRSKVDDPFPKKLIKTLRGIGYVIDVEDV